MTILATPTGNRSPTLAIIWQRFGPYHLARLRGANGVLGAHGWSCIGVEIAGRDQYAWDRVADGNASLFPDVQYEALSRGRIRRAVVELLDQVQPNVVAVNGWSAAEALAATAWCRRNRRGCIFMSESHQPSSRVWKEWVKRRRVARCDAALVGGRPHADYLATLGFPRARIFLGYDAVDNEFFRDGADEARRQAGELRSRLGLPKRYFYANSRFLPRKNIDGLLRAFKLFRETTESTWELVITGSGAMEAAWKQLAIALGIDRHVHWPGFVQYHHLPAYYGLASAFIHPARSEPWGLVVNEAAAAGLPLIVGDCVGAAAELVREGENGYAVDASSPEAIAFAMVRMERVGEPKRLSLGKRAQELVSRFSPNSFGEAMFEALRMGLEVAGGQPLAAASLSTL